MTYRLTTLLLCLVAFSTCRDDFSLEGELIETPVVYAYLDADSERHFVRVERAFLETGGNALVNAANPDVIYYGPEEATVRLVNVSTEGSVVLDRVNGQDFGFDREDGVFATEPNILYSVEDSEINLRPGQRVRIEIERPGQPLASAEAIMLREMSVIRPVDRIALDNYNRDVVVAWRTDENAQAFAVNVLFNIREINLSDPSASRDLQLTYPIINYFNPGSEDRSNNTVSFDASSEGFYVFLGDNLEPTDEFRRRLQSIDFQIIAAGQAVVDRQVLANANSGITSSQALPRFSNIDGGIGLFTTTTSILQEGIQITDASRDSLRDGQYTRQLGFLF